MAENQPKYPHPQNRPSTEAPEVEIDRHVRTLSFQQVANLTQVVDSQLAVPGRGNYPTLHLTVRQLVLAVRRRLEADGMGVVDVRINGGAASHIVVDDSRSGLPMYNDLDIIFRLEQPSTANVGGNTVPYDLDRVKDSALLSLLDFLPTEVNRGRLNPAVLSEAYLKKMVKIDSVRSGLTNGDCWSLISLHNDVGLTVEMKFVVMMRRQYEFSIDSFQVILDGFLRFFDVKPAPPEPSEHFYPTVIAESAYGDFEAAVRHAKDRLIATRNPEEVRGGGLLKYCALLARGYHHAEDFDAQTVERYMCTRFFIDFPDDDRQYSQLDNYLTNHFDRDSQQLRIGWLSTVRQVVSRSAVCLIPHRRKQTIEIINQLIDAKQQPGSSTMYAVAPPLRPHALSDCSTPTSQQLEFYGASDDELAANSDGMSQKSPSSATPSEVDQSETRSISVELPMMAYETSLRQPPPSYGFTGYSYGAFIPAIPYGGFYVPWFPVYYTTSHPPPMVPAFVQRS